MTRYTPSRLFLWTGLIALVLGGFCGGYAMFSASAIVPAVLFLGSAGLLLWLALQPAIGIGADSLWIGKRRIPWKNIARVDRACWISPLVVRLVLDDGASVLLVFAGESEVACRLLRHLRRSARYALIDGIPYRQFWGEPASAADDSCRLSSPRYRLLRKEDEEDVERMYQQLRTVGCLDATDSSEENKN